MKFFITITIVVAGLFLLGWLGLQIKPKSFQPYLEQPPDLNFVPLPDNLPEPVERFYRAAYGNEIPVIETVVIKGRAVLKPFGPEMSSRFIFVHNAGKDYRHYIESTWFGLPIMRINESYVDGNSYFELPIGTFENDPSITQGAGIGLWAEAAWFPSIWLTDERARWEPVDEKTALLYIPFGEGKENFVVRFDPETGLLDTLEAMRYRDPGDQAQKILWITKTLPGEYIKGTKLSTVGSATWLDQGKPWAVFTLEEVKYNLDVNEYIRHKGP